MKRILLIITMMMGIGSCVWAYDFSMPMQGYSLYYKILDEEDDVVEVTSPLADGTHRWMGHNSPRGVLIIPAEVEYDGIRYTVVSIGERAFAGCTDISGIVLPPTLTEIGASAFSGCISIRGKITIGEGVTSIGRSAFYGCTGITEVVFNAVECEMMGGSRSSIAFGNCRSLQKISFGPRVRRIPDYAFVGMDNLRGDLILPKDVEYIGEFAFAYCYGIGSELRIPAQVKTIGPYAFAQCHSITKVEMKANSVRIDQRAFYQCVKIKEINVKALVPPELGADVFAGIPEGVTVNVPCISANRYRKAEGWGKMKNIREVTPCKIELNAKVAEPTGGTVLGTGSYKVGDTAMLVAVCYEGYSFHGWTDGNRENPRYVVVDDTTTYTANIQAAEIVHEVEYVHDTTYMEGVEVIYETYEANDVAEPIASQERVKYNRQKRRVEVPIDRREIVGLSLYNDAGECLVTGRPRRGRINMRRYPTGYYIIRVTTIDKEQYLRFFHLKK